MNKVELPSYGKIWQFGSPALAELLNGYIVVQEKIDGSQISFGVKEGRLGIRSKGVNMDLDAPQGQFQKAVDYLKGVAHLMPEGVVFRGEYLSKPKHNVLAYDRVPKNNIVLFDVVVPSGVTCEYATGWKLASWAEELDLEGVQTLWYGEGKDFQMEWIEKFLVYTSQLGGQPIEGFVVKNYGQPDPKEPGAFLKGKYVSPKFKEIHKADWKETNPGKADILVQLKNLVNKEVYWQKAVQHLRDEGRLLGEPKDIGPLIKMINDDVDTELQDMAKEMLWKWARKTLAGSMVAGFPEWYKESLAAFPKEEEAE